MKITFVNISVKKEYLKEFIEATKENQKNSILEKGNIRFDFLQSKKDETKFMLVEIYENEEAAQEHKKTAHYLKWRETVEKMMACPREGIDYIPIAPTEINNFKYPEK